MTGKETISYNSYGACIFLRGELKFQGRNNRNMSGRALNSNLSGEIHLLGGASYYLVGYLFNGAVTGWSSVRASLKDFVLAPQTFLFCDNGDFDLLPAPFPPGGTGTCR